MRTRRRQQGVTIYFWVRKSNLRVSKSSLINCEASHSNPLPAEADGNSRNRLAKMIDPRASIADHDELLAQMISMGFDPVKAEQAQEFSGWGVDGAI
jgi:hypothetical protein